MPEVRLRVLLPKNRNKSGVLRIEISGVPVDEYEVLGRGSRGPGTTWKLNKGNTPTGSYDGSTIVSTSSWPQSSYGPWGAIRLKPLSGNALMAEELGRRGLLIHGGTPGGESYWRGEGQLRATHGCLRLSNENMRKLLDHIAAAGIDESNKQSVQPNIRVIIESSP